MNRKLKAGFIGFGRMGITHFSLLNTHPQVEVVGICDDSSAMLDALKKYLQANVYRDFREMLAVEKPDFVVISTPTESHADCIGAALDQGVHVFSEKPFCLDVAEGEDILRRLAEKPVVNQVGYVNRFNEVFLEVRRLLQAGLLGEIKQFSSEMYGATVLQDAKSGWRGKKSSGGGCMYEMASHCIDLALYLFGKPDLVTGSVLQKIFSSDVEDLVSSTFVYHRGYSGSIHVNWSDAAYRKPTNIIKVFGTGGKIIADKHAYKIYLREPAPDHGFVEGWNTRYITDFAESVRFYVRGNEFTRQLDYFIDCIETGNLNNVAGFAEALKTDAVMAAVSADASQPRTDPDAGDAAARQGDTRHSSLLRKLFQ